MAVRPNIVRSRPGKSRHAVGKNMPSDGEKDTFADIVLNISSNALLLLKINTLCDMESTRFLMALCASLCIILPAEARPDQETSTEKKAEMRAGKMKETLDLSEKQYNKLFKLFKKTEKSLLKARQQNTVPPGGPGMMMPPGGRPMPEGGFNGGPGMPQGQWMPPRGNNEDMAGDTKDLKEGGNIRPETGYMEKGPGMRPAPEAGKFPGMPAASGKEMSVIRKENAKIRKILTEEQFAKWEEASKKAEMEGRHQRHGQHHGPEKDAQEQARPSESE